MTIEIGHGSRPSGSLIIEKPECKAAYRISSTRPEVDHKSLIITILATLFIRIAGRLNFLLLTFYLGEHFSSAVVITLALEAYYITELLLSPVVGGLSDRYGRRPFLVFGPVPAVLAALCYFIIARVYPQPNPTGGFGLGIVILLLAILLGRLLEGAATGFNVPATLGYFTDVTVGSERLRTKVNTAFEIATVAGMALAIPVAGRISDLIGTNGFLIVLGFYLLTTLLMFFGVKERVHRHKAGATRDGSLLKSFTLLRHRRIFTFIPAWFAVNALIGALPNQLLLIMTYLNPAADLRHPGQLLYGGFSKSEATLWVGAFALCFLLGMGVWMFFVPKMRRSTVMCIGLGGLLITIIALTFMNGLAENMQSLSPSQMPALLVLIGTALLGLFLLSAFTPVALSQMSAIAETLPGKRGAVMGLYSVVLGLGQALGQGIGSGFVDGMGFYGLMLFSSIMLVVSLLSVLYMRVQGDDLFPYRR
jgi:MFS family permease